MKSVQIYKAAIAEMFIKEDIFQNHKIKTDKIPFSYKPFSAIINLLYLEIFF